MAETRWLETLALGVGATRDWLNRLVNQCRNWPAPPAEPVNANENSIINLDTLNVKSIVIRPGGSGIPGGGGGTSGNATQLQGRAVAGTAPNNGQALVWNGSAWVPGNVGSGGTAEMTASSNPAAAAPVGTRCWHSSPIAGGNAGWIFTTTGWKAFGSIEE